MVRRLLGVAAVLGVSTLAAPAKADIIYETSDPFGDLGINGFDVFEHQSVAVRFTPEHDFLLDVVAVWFMNNDASGDHFGEVTLTVRNDLDDNEISIPGSEIFDTIVFTITAVGWDPHEEVLQSISRPLLREGVNYWLVAESDDPPFIDPVWNIAGNSTGFMAFTHHETGEWQPGGKGGVVSVRLEGTPAPGAPGDLNCDGQINAFDIEPFLVALFDPDIYGVLFPDCDIHLADINGDGNIDAFDIEPFLNLLFP